MVFNILPTLIEITMVAVILMAQFSVGYALGILLAVGAYVGFSVVVTEWRSKYVREANERDSQSNTRAIDSLLNFETVKYFNNEAHEIREYDRHLSGWEQARINTRLSLSALNSGQAFIIAASVTVMLVMALMKIGAALLAASSAPRLSDTINLSTCEPKPIWRNFVSTFFTSSGNGILIFGFK